MIPDAADPIMISALEHYSYCPRQCVLMCAGGEGGAFLARFAGT